MVPILQQKLLNNNRGNTLIEMTVVLFIVAVVSSMSVGNFKTSYEANNRDEFVEQLKRDLYYAQQLAISNQITTSVVFLNGSKEYVLNQGGKRILTRKYLPNTSFYSSTLSLRDIAFLPDGNSSKSGTLLFEINNTSYKLVILLGRGRFYIEQL